MIAGVSRILYYNAGTDKWCMTQPDWLNSPIYPKADQLNAAINDLNLIDVVNYDNPVQNEYAQLIFVSDASEYFLTRNGEKIKINDTTDLRDEGIIAYYVVSVTVDGESEPDTLNLVLPNLTESYTVAPASEAPC